MYVFEEIADDGKLKSPRESIKASARNQPAEDRKLPTIRMK
jgi:hypothetical protein